MLTDKRYTTAKKLISGGYLQSFREIFDIVPKSVMVADLRMNSARFTKLMYRVQGFKLSDIFRIAKLLDVDERQILLLIHDQYKKDQQDKSTHT